MTGTSAYFITFDLDGTLEDSRADMVAAVARVRSRLSLAPLMDETIVPHVNKGMAHLYRECFREVVGDHGPGHKAYEDIALQYEEDYASHIVEQTRLYEGIAEALATLGERATLAVATNKPERLSRLLLAELQIDHLFTTVIGGDTAVAPKPDAAVVEAALARSHLLRSSLDGLFHVGDTAGDMRLAKNAGVVGVWAAWGYVDRPGEEEPDLTAMRPSELASVIFPQ